MASMGFTKYATIHSETVVIDAESKLEADVKVCSSDDGDPLWCEAVLFEDGSEVECTEMLIHSGMDSSLKDASIAGRSKLCL